MCVLCERSNGHELDHLIGLHATLKLYIRRSIFGASNCNYDDVQLIKPIHAISALATALYYTYMNALPKMKTNTIKNA